MARIEYKTPAQLLLMRKAGLVVGKILKALSQAAQPGVTTGELDSLAREMIAANNVKSSFLNYGADWGYPPFPGVICASVNEEVVHGIPGNRKLVAGDILSIDFGVHWRGFHGDAAVTVLVGESENIAPPVAKLSQVTKEALWDGIAAMKLGGRIGDISAAVQASILAAGNYGILRDYTGHGIGSEMHQEPAVPNYGRPGTGAKIREGLVIAIEPMVTLGSEETVTLADEWTVVSLDGSVSAHWEHTVTATKTGLWVLTAEDGGEAELTARGLPFGPLAD